MGYLYVLTASILFGISPALSALLQKNGWSNGAVLLNNELSGALYLFLLIRSRRISFRVSGREFAAAAGVSGAAFWGTNLLLQASYELLPNPGITTVLHFVYPVIVMGIMALLFRERITPLKLTCLVLSLCGVVLTAGVSGTSRQSAALLSGVLAALASGVTYAVYIVANDKSPARGIHPLVLTFYVLLGGAALNSVYLLISHDFGIDLSGGNPLYALAMPLCSFSALLAIAEGIRRIGPTRAAVINMLEPVVSMLVSAAVFPSEPLTARMTWGGALILLSTGAIALLNNSGGKQRRLLNQS